MNPFQAKGYDFLLHTNAKGQDFMSRLTCEKNLYEACKRHQIPQMVAKGVIDLQTSGIFLYYSLTVSSAHFLS